MTLEEYLVFRNFVTVDTKGQDDTVYTEEFKQLDKDDSGTIDHVEW